MGSLIGRPTNLGSNYWIDVQDGKIPGKSLVGVTGVREGLTDTAFVDVIEPGVTPGLATSAESLEVVSDSAEDGAGGSTGLLALVLFGLDANYDEAIPALVITSGATPVAVPGTYLATRQMIIVGSGTTKRNVGTINLNIVGDASTVRLQMLPERSNTFSSIYTVPTGFSARVVQLLPLVSKNSDIILRPVLITAAGETTGQDVPIYQNSVVAPLLAPFTVAGGDSFKFQAKRTDAGLSHVSVIAETLLTVNP